MTSTPVDLPQEYFRINRNIWQALTIKVGASFLTFFQKQLTWFPLPRVISRKMIFSAKIPSKHSLKLAISEGIVHFCEKTCKRGVGKYTFKSFIGRGTKFFIIFQNHVRFYLSQYRVSEGTNKSKRKNDKNAKKYHEFFASCQVIWL